MQSRVSLDSIVSRFSLVSLICALMLTVGVGNAWGDTYTLVTSNSSLSNGDKVVLAIKTNDQPGNKGVAGWNSNKDATISETASDWVQYTVSSASASGWKLYDPDAKKSIASPGSSNQFTYGTAATCSVNSNGVLVCNSRYLCNNGSNYRFYSSIGSYTPFYVWKVTAGSGEGGCDELDKAFTGNPGSYTAWSGKSGSASDAVYAGQSSGNNNSIQIRATSPSGIVSTTTGGWASSVTVNWNANTTDGNVLQVYGKNTAYSSASDLYSASSSTQGTLLGTIVKGTSTELVISGTYAYIGLRSSSGALYLTKVTICWGDEACSTDPELGTPTLSSISNGTISVTCPTISAGSGCTIDDYGFVWVSGGSDPTISNNKTSKGTNNQSTAYSDNLSINSFSTGTTYKIKAYAHNDHGNGLSTSSLTVIPQSITYNGNTSTSGSMSTQYVNRNTSTALTSNSYSKTGCTFAGWATSTDGDVVYTDGQSVSIASNLTLYAKWNQPKYTVTYDGNGKTGGSVPTDGTAYNSDATVTVKDNSGNLAKTGWEFAGWNANNTGTGTNYTAGSGTFNITANTTLYAKWTRTVNWSVNGVVDNNQTQTITYNPSGSKVSSVPTPSVPQDCNSSTFMGWTTSAIDGETNTAPTPLFKTVEDSPNLNSITSSVTVTFYAVFAEEQ